ncbi:hypothetical protein FHETE_3221 [Fusarium heterosporum]|uniref:Uncharacterized protein n=1 Tax=Fusarium heterosporum TaxID=42747 RepID=A0A8H5WXP4_FUSHE|nr:hypothetical protein FHETE_3221 [Fusarium heterosporum]
MPVDQELIDVANGDMALATSLDHALPRAESMSSKIERWTVDPQSPCHLFKLPKELRLDIYELALEEQDTYLDRYGKPILRIPEPQWLLHELPKDTENPSPEHSSLKELGNIFHLLHGHLWCHTNLPSLGIDTHKLRPSAAPVEWRCIKDLQVTFTTEGLTAQWRDNARCLPGAFICMPSLNRVTSHFEDIAERFHILRDLAETAHSQWKFQLGGKRKGYCLKAHGSIKEYSWRGLWDTDLSFWPPMITPPVAYSRVNAPVGTIGGISRAEYIDTFVEFERRHRHKISGGFINHSFWDLIDL